MQLIATVEARKVPAKWFVALHDADYRIVVDECARLKAEGYKVRVRGKRLIAPLPAAG